MYFFCDIEKNEIQQIIPYIYTDMTSEGERRRVSHSDVHRDAQYKTNLQSGTVVALESNPLYRR